MTPMQTVAAARSDRVGERLPIFSALDVLGLSYAEIGRLLGVSTVSVHHWATGKKPLPLVRHLALLFLVTRLTGVVGAADLPQTRYARRAEIAIDAARRWCQLARDELEEDQRGTYHAEDIERGIALGQRMLARLEAAAAA
jgi:DNA-binding transcriptional regulator YdaS (Cro superfamily)